jgi:hypothetical protein
MLGSSILTTAMKASKVGNGAGSRGRPDRSRQNTQQRRGNPNGTVILDYVNFKIIGSTFRARMACAWV